jgi:hypothetical protein
MYPIIPCLLHLNKKIKKDSIGYPIIWFVCITKWMRNNIDEKIVDDTKSFIWLGFGIWIFLWIFFDVPLVVPLRNIMATRRHVMHGGRSLIHTWSTTLSSLHYFIWLNCSPRIGAHWRTTCMRDSRSYCTPLSWHRLGDTESFLNLCRIILCRSWMHCTQCFRLQQ